MRWWLVVLAAIGIGCSTTVEATDDERERQQLAVESTQSPTTITSEPPTPTIPTNSEPTSEPESEPRSESDPESGSESGDAIVFMPGGLHREFATLAAGVDGVGAITVVASGSLRLVESRDATGRIVDDPADGFAIPVEAVAFDDSASTEIISPDLPSGLAGLSAGEAALSEASAALRRLGVGGSLTFEDGSTHRVGAILADETMGPIEVILVGLDRLPAPASAIRERAFVEFDGTRSELEEALTPLLGGEPFRIFGGRDDPGSGPESGRGRPTISQIALKQVFGEFAFRPETGGAVTIDPAWVEDNIVSTELPLLGFTRCHRVYAEILRTVMNELIADGLSDLIDPSAFQGCWNPRFIGRSARLSRHAWGAAADINFANPTDGGPGSPVNEELLARMDAAGITSGHLWSIPDPGHFEYREPASNPSGE